MKRKKNKAGKEAEMPVSLFVFISRALFLYGFVWVLSWWGGLYSGSVTTFLVLGSVLALIVLGMCLQPAWVFLVGVVYSLIFLLTSLAEGKELDTLTYLRAINIVVAGGLAAWIALLQKRSHKELAEISVALLQLPLGVILSDHQGTIQFANGQACRLLALGSEDLWGRSFFSVFSVPEAGGEFLVDYQSLMTTPANQTNSVMLRSRREMQSPITATITPLRVSNRILLLTTLTGAANSSAVFGP